MKTFTLFATTLLATASLTAGATDQTPGATAPPSAATAVAPDVSVLPAPNQIIYSPRLPTATDLTNVAAAQGMTVERIVDNGSQITAVYRTSGGQAMTVAYQLLPTAATTAGQTVVVPAAPVPATTPPPAVYYSPANRVVYYSAPYYDARYYDPFYDWWYPPVSVGIGFDYVYHGGGGFRGGGHRGFHHR